ncbi:MAG: SGNH/GDSL hydrolase family protein [Oscillospiraceae bacterium]|nr:SGNH/GDSL hydrolase family protein [Oscillospiraceae bacterium]
MIKLKSNVITKLVIVFLSFIMLFSIFIIAKSYLSSNTHESKYEDFVNKNWTSYGDSITYLNSWQPYVCNNFPDLDHTNLGINGTTIAHIPSLEKILPCFINETRLNNVKASNPDIITILGGTNDCAHQVAIGDDSEFSKPMDEKNKTTFKGAYSFLIETLLEWKPSLTIVLITTIHSPYDSIFSIKLADYAKATIDVAKYYSLPCIDVFGKSGINLSNIYEYTYDGIHPNDAGGQIIAGMVIKEFDSLLVNN